KFLQKLVSSLYARSEADFLRGTFRVKGDVTDIYPAYSDQGVRVHFFGDTIEEIEIIDPKTGKRMSSIDRINIYPANLFVTSPETLNGAIKNIQIDLGKQVNYFQEIGKHLEAKRLQERTEFDVE